jgi:FkbM family methyltransferase
VDTDRPAVMPFTMPKYGYRLQLQASDSTGDAAFRLDKSTVSWLREHVGIGDVVYDIGAGAGVYTLLAAKHHGAVVVAFEPGYAAFKDLCDNLRLNGCDGQVIPLPLALAEFDGVGELKYPTGMAGHSRHSVRPGAWQVRRASGDDGHFRQPVCAISLDQALQRHGLPAPNHLRLGNASSAEGVLAGAARVLGLDSLKTIFFTLPVTEGEAVATRLARSSWAIARHIPISRGRAHVLMSRSVVGAPPSGRERS